MAICHNFGLNTLRDEHFQNAQDFSITIESTNAHLVKESYAECLGYNYPNIPEDYKDVSGESSGTQEGAVIVGADNHILFSPSSPSIQMIYSLLFDSGALPSLIVLTPFQENQQ